MIMSVFARHAASAATSLMIISGVVGPTATVAVSDSGPAPTTLVTFNDPQSAPRAIRQQENRIIRSTYRGRPRPTIAATFYHLSDVRFADRLVKAARRGVSVRILLDGSTRTLGCPQGHPRCVNPAFTALSRINAIGSASTDWVRTCDGSGRAHPHRRRGHGYGCIGQDRNHNKFILVTDSRYLGGTPTDLALQTSSNNTAGSYAKAFNNTLIFVNQPAVFDDYSRYFARLAKSFNATRRPPVAKFERHYGFSDDSSADQQVATWTFPRIAGEDPLATNLAAVQGDSCQSGSSQGDPEFGHVDIAMYRVNQRPQVVDQLRRLVDLGCTVDIVYAEIGRSVRNTLAADGVGLQRLCLATPSRPTRVAAYLHSKYVLVAGDVEGLGSDARIVYAGSGNLDNEALTKTDDRILRYVEPGGASPVFNGYAANFQHLQSVSANGTQSRGKCSTGE
jgi:hypothetical protein